MPSNDQARAPRPFTSLASDSRGAILILGIIVAAVAAAGVYHLSEIGNAIVWREKSQSAADSAAFGNAAVHAMGMNGLVALNIIMAGAMAVLIIWRVIMYLASIAAGILLVACGAAWLTAGATGIACTLYPHAQRISTQMWNRDAQVTRVVLKVCAGINVLEKLVATATPPVAMASAMFKTLNDYNANWAIAVSPSIALPPAEKIKADGMKAMNLSAIKEKVTECFKGNRARRPGSSHAGGHGSSHGGGHGGHSRAAHTWEEASQRRMGFLFSLPAQEDHLGKLCGKASVYLDPLLMKAAKGMGAEEMASFIGWLSGVKEKVFATIPSLFCSVSARDRQALTNDLNSMLDGAAKDQCQKAKDDFMKLEIPERQKHEFYSPNAPRGQGRSAGWGSFDRTKCERKAKDEMKKEQPEHERQQVADALECVKPARVWEVSRNGNLFMQSFSGVSLSDGPPSAAPPPSPTPGPAPTPPPPPGASPGTPSPSPGAAPTPSPTLPPQNSANRPRSRTVRAQAEMYFDCGAKAKSWIDDCDPYAMWKFKWKAKLTNIKPVSKMATEAIGSAAAAGIAHGLHEIIGEGAFHNSNHPFMRKLLGRWADNPKVKSALAFGGENLAYGLALTNVTYPLHEWLRDVFVAKDQEEMLLH